MWYSGLQALGTPTTAQTDWNAVLTAVRKIDQLNSDQITVVNERDTATFAAASSALGSTQGELVAATEKAGVADCADVRVA